VSIPLKPLKWYRNLVTKQGRLEAGAFLVEGDRAILQIMSNHPEAIMEIVSVEEPLPAYDKYPLRLVTKSQFDYISQTKTPQGMAAVIRLPEDIYADGLPDDSGHKILILEDIQDPGNAGTLIRTAAAFDFSGVILTENGADPLSPKCVQATAGTVLSLWLRRTTNYLELVRALKQRHYTLVATDLKGETEPSILCRQSQLLLALGNEAAGLSKTLLDMADYRVMIPVVAAKAESLNVAACGAICMYLSSQNIEE
jgi:TrmH family RNA methyltransferase